MPPKPTLTKAVAMQTVTAVNAANGNIEQAAAALGISRGSLHPRLRRAWQLYKLRPREKPERALADGTDLVMERLRQENVILRQSNKKLRDAQLSAEIVREMVAGTRDIPDPPDWYIERDRTSNHGVPTLMVSDWHWGETVEPPQVNYVNAYNLEIADKRWRTMVEKTVNLMLVHMANPKYDYLCLPIIGDMLSGLIHEELRETNWATMADCLVQMRSRVIWAIDEFLEAFKKVHVIWMVGNHGRIDRKPRYKNAVYDNWEYVLGEQIRFYYQGTKALHFDLPTSTEYLYNVCRTRYLAMHGDQWKGGSGISAALSPMMIGRARKKEAALATNQMFDVIIHGHWHYHRNLGDVIGNGSGKGFDEYAMKNNFQFQEPIQALWVTHPDYGITAAWPIYLERRGRVYR